MIVGSMEHLGHDNTMVIYRQSMAMSGTQIGGIYHI